MSDIKIPKDIFDQILSVVGCPFVTYAPDNEDPKDYDLEINEEQIKNIIMTQCFKEYFKWFPIETYDKVSVSGTFEVAFPNNYVFSAKDVRINTKASYYEVTSNPLINSQFMYNAGSYGTRSYGTRYDYGYTSANIIKNVEMQSRVDRRKAFKWQVLKNQRKIVGFSNIAGMVEITWASYCLDWDFVAFEQQLDLIQLCQGKLLDYIGHIRKQIDVPDVPIELDGQVMIDEGKDLITGVYDKWKKFTVPIIFRG